VPFKVGKYHARKEKVSFKEKIPCKKRESAFHGKKYMFGF
jgi:hypothetical protein